MISKHNPGRGVAFSRPVIVGTAELGESPGPKAKGHIRMHKQAVNMFFHDPDSALSAGLHGMVVPRRGAQGNAPIFAPNLEGF